MGNPVGGNNGVCNTRFNPIVPCVQRESVFANHLAQGGAFKNRFVQLRNPIISSNASKRNGDSGLFDVATLTAEQWLFVVGSAFSIVPIVEIAGNYACDGEWIMTNLISLNEERFTSCEPFFQHVLMRSKQSSFYSSVYFAKIF